MELKEQVELLGAEVAKVLEKAEGQHTENQKMSADTKAELVGVVEKHNEANESLVKSMEVMQAQVDGIATEVQERKSNEGSKLITLKDALFGLGDNESYKNFQGNNKLGFDMDIKADMLASTHYTGDVIAPDRLGITPIFTPERMVRMRDLVPGGSMSGSVISYPQEGTVVDNTAMVAEGGTKPQNEFDIDQIESSAKKIAAYVRISDEALTDVPYMASYLSSRLISKLKNVEDTQLLYGSGVGENLDGIYTQRTVFTGTELNQSYWNVLRKAISEARVAEYFVNAILLNPADAALLDIAASSSDGHYLVPSFVSRVNGKLFISGVPVIESTFVTADTFLVGDFNLGAQLFDRMGANVRFFEQDADNVTTNKVTVRVEERLALSVYHTGAFVGSTFTLATA